MFDNFPNPKKSILKALEKLETNEHLKNWRSDEAPDKNLMVEDQSETET